MSILGSPVAAIGNVGNMIGKDIFSPIDKYGFGTGLGDSYAFLWELVESLDEFSGMTGIVERESAGYYVDVNGVLQVADGDSTPFSHSSIANEATSTITGDFTDLAADLIDDESILDGYLSTGNLVIVEDDAGLFAYGYMGAASGAGCEIYKDYELSDRGWNAIDTGFDTLNLTAFDVYTNLLSSTGSTAQPRFESTGLLSEGEGTNWCLQSNGFDEWTAFGGMTEVQNVTGPDGVANSAWTITDPGGNANYSFYINNSSANIEDYTYSVFVKKGTSETFSLVVYDFTNGLVKADIDFDWVTGVPTPTNNTGTGEAEQLGSTDWWRCKVYPTTLTVGAITRTYLYSSERGVDPVTPVTTIFYGAQLEPTPYATSYIPTTTIPVTRTADAHSWTMSTEFKNLMGNVADSPFTMVCEWAPKFDYGDTSANKPVISVELGSKNLLRHKTDGDLYSLDGTQVSGVTPNYTTSTTYIYALRVYDDAGTMKFEVGEKHGGSWTWDATPADYDGSFNPATDFLIGYLNQYPFNIKNIYFYDEAKEQAWIESEFI